MKISVIIPAYNASATIRDTLNGVMNQTLPPHEIIIMNDGSTDNTRTVMEGFGNSVRLFEQANAGLAASRNALCELATGDLIAFLDADDIWHPRYLEMQSSTFEQNPDSVAVFTAHRDFYDGKVLKWDAFDSEGVNPVAVRFDILTFLKTYNWSPGPFANLSHCCVPKRALNALGPEPFRLRIAEDVYFIHRLALLSPGPVTYLPIPLSGYRLRAGSLSWNRVALNCGEVHALELLSNEYHAIASKELLEIFYGALKMKRRLYAKALLTANDRPQARRQLRASVGQPWLSTSSLKSFGLLAVSYLPRFLQPAWTPLFRNVTGVPSL